VYLVVCCTKSRARKNQSGAPELTKAPPGDNRTQRGRWTRGIFPASARDINASVRADN
jgi:hypothetical protein